MTRNSPMRTVLPFLVFFVLVAVTGFAQSWTVALTIMNMCLVSAVMALGVNVQWGYAGLVNFGVMGFTALGGLAVVLVAVPRVDAAWQAGGPKGMHASSLLWPGMAAVWLCTLSSFTTQISFYCSQ